MPGGQRGGLGLGLGYRQHARRDDDHQGQHSEGDTEVMRPCMHSYAQPDICLFVCLFVCLFICYLFDLSVSVPCASPCPTH